MIGCIPQLQCVIEMPDIEKKENESQEEVESQEEDMEGRTWLNA